MAELISTITSKGQVTIPVEVRRRLGLKEGDKIAFVVGEDGSSFQARPCQYPTIASLRGAAGSLPKAMSWDEMIAIAYEDRLMAKFANT